MSLLDTFTNLSSGDQIREAEELLKKLEETELTSEQLALVVRLHEILRQLDSNNSTGLFI
ncbi:hypothetical protein [Hymenobacter cavernae]|uniref:Uncharacterized protein n=1 Tax=Hymenobacter cavernae TaxID=2044852 RepID=A0ABQ1U210_9BACT|nr:hypothetical protein [Hymenobacter cavernae]GGF08742.1 hypothetical protein GCM10011383_19880 [Hymenobacter cavernae]